MGRADRATSRTVACIKSCLHISRRHGATADPLQRADETAHLIVQKGPRTYIEMYFGAIFCLDGFDPDFVHSFHRAGRLTDGRAEGGEVMAPHQNSSGFAHGVEVHLLFDLPDKAAQMRQRGAARQNAEQISPLQRSKSRVERVRHFGAVYNRYGVRLEVIIDCLGQAEGRPVALHIAMDNLA